MKRIREYHLRWLPTYANTKSVLKNNDVANDKELNLALFSMDFHNIVFF